jgi:hypothetical protein
MSLRIGKPGKAAFGSFTQTQNSGASTQDTTCTTSYCNTSITLNNKFKSGSDRLLYKKSYYLNTVPNTTYNKSNLSSNLVTKLDLQNYDSSVVPVIQNNGPPATVPTEIIITPSTVSYLDYTIDPCGNLFGNTPCGLNNYRQYLVYNPPP